MEKSAYKGPTIDRKPSKPMTAKEVMEAKSIDKRFSKHKSADKKK